MLDLSKLTGGYGRRLWLIPALLAIACFINTFEHGFISDDIHLIPQAVSVLEERSSVAGRTKDLSL